MVWHHATELLIHYSPACSLQSSDKALLVIPCSRLKTRGDRAFAVRAPTLWNSLPEEFRHENLLLTFKSALKIDFYRMAFV